MSDFEDYLSGLSNSVITSRAPDFAEMDAAIERLCASRYAVRHAIRVNLTESDMAALLSRYGVKPGPNEVGRWPLASLRGLPIFYGERSEIVFNDGTTEPLTAPAPR